MRRGRSLTAVFVLAILLGIAGARWGAEAYRQHKAARPPQTTVPEGYACVVGADAKMYSGHNVESFGEAKAPLKALWVLPNHALAPEVLQTIEDVKQWVGKHPSLVRLTLATIHTKEAGPVMKAEGVNCAGVSIAGRTRFDLWDRQKRQFRHVAFEKAPSPVSYMGPDIIDLFEQYLENARLMPANRTVGQPSRGARPGVDSPGVRTPPQSR